LSRSLRFASASLFCEEGAANSALAADFAIGFLGVSCKILNGNTFLMPTEFQPSRACAPGIVMKRLRALVLLASALALGGCDITASANAPRDAGPPVTTGAALGGLIGSKIGTALDDQDRLLAYDAQINALENGAAGAPVPWRNQRSGHHGNIVAGPAYDIRGAKCRGYSHTVSINDQLQTARGTACRRSDGSWTAAS
jgi:surface antigen